MVHRLTPTLNPHPHPPKATATTAAATYTFLVPSSLHIRPPLLRPTRLYFSLRKKSGDDDKVGGMVEPLIPIMADSSRQTSLSAVIIILTFPPLVLA